MSNTFSVTVLDVVPIPPVETFATRHKARRAARTASARGVGRRVQITATLGPTREHYFIGVRTHHFTRTGNFVMDDRQVYREAIVFRFGEPFAAALLGPVAPVGDSGAPAANTPKSMLAESMLAGSMLSDTAGDGDAAPCMTPETQGGEEDTLDTRAFAAFLADYIADTLDQGSDYLAGTPITQISNDGPCAMFTTGGTPYVVRVTVEEAARETADQG